MGTRHAGMQSHMACSPNTAGLPRGDEEVTVLLLDIYAIRS